MWGRGRGRGGWTKKTPTKNASEKKQTSQTGEDKRVWSIVREGKALSLASGCLAPLPSSLIVYSFDPATDNYGMRVEKREASGKVTTLLMKTVNLGGRIDELYENLSSVLSEIGSRMPPPNLVIVERQPPTNYWTVRLSQHTIAYYMLMTSATVVEVNPRTCLSILGCPTEQGVRKKWALWYSEQFLHHMRDEVGLAIMAGKLPGGTKGTGGIHRGGVKVDDMAITLCQSEALLQHWKGWFPPKTSTLPITPPTIIPYPAMVTSIPLSTPIQIARGTELAPPSIRWRDEASSLTPSPSLPWMQVFSSTTTMEKVSIPTQKSSSTPTGQFPIPTEKAPSQESIMIDIPQVNSHIPYQPQISPHQQKYTGAVDITIQAMVRY